MSKLRSEPLKRFLWFFCKKKKRERAASWFPDQESCQSRLLPWWKKVRNCLGSVKMYNTRPKGKKTEAGRKILKSVFMNRRTRCVFLSSHGHKKMALLLLSSKPFPLKLTERKKIRADRLVAPRFPLYFSHQRYTTLPRENDRQACEGTPNI